MPPHRYRGLAGGPAYDLSAPICAGGQEADWLTGLPEEVGLDSEVLADVFDYVKQHEIPVHSVQIVRRGRLVLDAISSRTMSKCGTLSRRLPRASRPLWWGRRFKKDLCGMCSNSWPTFFTGGAWTNPDEQKQRITLENLLTMQAGWDCEVEPNEARLFEMRRSADWLQFMLDLPMVADPGACFAYCSGNPHGFSIARSQTTGTNALAFANGATSIPRSW